MSKASAQQCQQLHTLDIEPQEETVAFLRRAYSQNEGEQSLAG